MSTRTRKPAIIDVDITVVREVLERARAALSREDHAYLEGMVQTLIDLSKLVRERGTTIVRLRRLFGLASSEKTADVFGNGAPGGATQPGSDAAAASASARDDCADASVGASPADDRVGAADADADKSARKGHGRIGATEYSKARLIYIEHETLHAGDVCPKCARGKLYRLRKPARIVRIIGQPPLAAAACDCEQLRCGGCGEVFTARAPEEAQGPKYADSAVSMMALLRYGAGMPLNRLGRLQSNLDTPVPASTQWEVVRDRTPALEPVYKELRRLAAQGQVLHNDDTSVRILELMGKRRANLLAQGKLEDPERTGLFTTAIMAITSPGPIALFFSGRKHAGENIGKLLDERDRELAAPIQMCDGLDRNFPQSHDVIESNCLCHGRRHVVDEVDNFPAPCRYLLEQLGKVFKNESTCRKQGMSAEQRLEFHQRESGSIMAELEAWMKAELDEKRVEPNSGLGEALRYLLKRWDKMTTFLRLPGAPLENNICERALKMAIRHRNNSLFYRSLRGAKVGDIYMSLIYTAELHRENPFEYLKALFEHERDVAASPASWLPWTYRATLAMLALAARPAA